MKDESLVEISTTEKELLEEAGLPGEDLKGRGFRFIGSGEFEVRGTIGAVQFQIRQEEASTVRVLQLVPTCPIYMARIVQCCDGACAREPKTIGRTICILGYIFEERCWIGSEDGSVSIEEGAARGRVMIID